MTWWWCWWWGWGLNPCKAFSKRSGSVVNTCTYRIAHILDALSEDTCRQAAKPKSNRNNTASFTGFYWLDLSFVHTYVGILTNMWLWEQDTASFNLSSRTFSMCLDREKFTVPLLLLILYSVVVTFVIVRSYSTSSPVHTTLPCASSSLLLLLLSYFQ